MPTDLTQVLKSPLEPSPVTNNWWSQQKCLFLVGYLRNLSLRPLMSQRNCPPLLLLFDQKPSLLHQNLSIVYFVWDELCSYLLLWDCSHHQAKCSWASDLCAWFLNVESDPRRKPTGLHMLELSQSLGHLKVGLVNSRTLTSHINKGL